MSMRRQRRGANAVEFALIAPVLLMVIAGIMEYSWLLFNQIMLDAAAREGARVGAWTAGTFSEVEDAAVLAAEEFWDSLGIPGVPSFGVGDDFKVSQGQNLLVLQGTLVYPGLIGFYTPTPAELSASVAVRREL